MSLCAPGPAAAATAAVRSTDAPFWATGVGYQVYPITFADSDGDGIGDLAGIRSRLDHLEWLGVDLLWLSPINPSPWADCGYDVADYCAVDPRLGTLDDLDALVADAHGRGMRVLLDLVPNHTSDRHPWFVEARPTREASRRDWYVWRDPGPDGGPPNNWVSIFGGPTWTFDPGTGQYYLHSFLPEQPELDWENPAVAGAFRDVFEFWFAHGIDGFRIDVVYRLMKEPGHPDNPWLPGAGPGGGYLDQEHRYDMDRPAVHEVVRSLRSWADAARSGHADVDEKVLLGETTIVDPVRVASYYGNGSDELHLAFNFTFAYRDWTAEVVAEALAAQEDALPEGCQAAWVLSNHDVPRHADRFGDDALRSAALVLLTLRGTPFLYQGDELGLHGGDVPPSAARDRVGRDPQRCPIPWGDAAAAAPPSGGAADRVGQPWLPMSPVPPDGTAAGQRADRSSLLWFHRRLLAVRRAIPALHGGDWSAIDGPADVVSYRRRHQSSEAAVFVGFAQTSIAAVSVDGLVPVLDTHGQGSVVGPHQGVLLADPLTAARARAALAALSD